MNAPCSFGNLPVMSMRNGIVMLSTTTDPSHCPTTDCAAAGSTSESDTNKRAAGNARRSADFMSGLCRGLYQQREAGLESATLHRSGAGWHALRRPDIPDQSAGGEREKREDAEEVGDARQLRIRVERPDRPRPVDSNRVDHGEDGAQEIHTRGLAIKCPARE